MKGFGYNFGHDFGIGENSVIIAFITNPETEGTYHLTTTGDVTPMTDEGYTSKSGQRVRATSNFDIYDLQNGHTYVTGSSGNGYGDAFVVTGRIVDAKVDETMYVEKDYQEVDIESLYLQEREEDERTSSLMQALHRFREFTQTGK